MRLFQRAFKRASLPLKHTQGFNPRPSVSIALPLSVGVASSCELLDFDLDCEFDQWDQLPERLNSVLVEGVRVLQVYHNGRKIRDLSLMRSVITLEYDKGVPDAATSMIDKMLSQDVLTVVKKTKSGPQEQNIIPMIRRFALTSSQNEIAIEVMHCCQNPTLNPMQIPAAIVSYLPDYAPDFSKCCRIEIYDNNEVVFR
jgi:radical SAM-linked protein